MPHHGIQNWVLADLQNCEVEHAQSILLLNGKCIIKTRFKHSWKEAQFDFKSKSQFPGPHSYSTPTLPSIRTQGFVGIPYLQLKNYGAVFWVGLHFILEWSLQFNISMVLKGSGKGKSSQGPEPQSWRIDLACVQLSQYHLDSSHSFTFSLFLLPCAVLGVIPLDSLSYLLIHTSTPLSHFTFQLTFFFFNWLFNLKYIFISRKSTWVFLQI